MKEDIKEKEIELLLAERLLELIQLGTIEDKGRLEELAYLLVFCLKKRL